MRYSIRNRALLITAPLLLAVSACAGTDEEPEDTTATEPDEPDEPTEPVEVDPADFARGNDVVFVSPSENLACGISAEGEHAFHAGCHAWSLVDNLPECDDPDANGPWVAIRGDAGFFASREAFEPSAPTNGCPGPPACQWAK